jgi:hypothetical protein
MRNMAATKPTSVVPTRAHPDAMAGSVKSGLYLAGRRFRRGIRAEPPQALRESLDVARASGIDFDSAWESSVEGALHGYRGSARRDWSYAIRETREVWRSAYLREPNGRLERWAGVLHQL